MRVRWYGCHRYEVWFNNTVPEWWIRKADADEGLEQANFVSDALRVQRAVDQAIIAVRVAAKHGVPVTTPALSVSLRKCVKGGRAGACRRSGSLAQPY